MQLEYSKKEMSNRRCRSEIIRTEHPLVHPTVKYADPMAISVSFRTGAVEHP